MICETTFKYNSVFFISTRISSVSGSRCWSPDFNVSATATRGFNGTGHLDLWSYHVFIDVLQNITPMRPLKKSKRQ